MAERIQLKRTRGWRLPEGAVVVSRPSRWGNPFKVGDVSVNQDTNQPHALTTQEAVDAFRTALLSGRMAMYTARPFTINDVRRELAGKDLACWCKPGEACHADILLAIANEPMEATHA